MLFYSTAAFAAGYALDLLIGDPQGWPHLIRLYGWLISSLEKRLYPVKNKLLGGGMLVLIVLILCGGVPAVLLGLAWRVSPWMYFAVESLLCWQLLAAKSLKKAAMEVYYPLEKGDISGARNSVSMIVGRDTAGLDQAGITRAAVETVAENASDGVAAPMLYMLLGGATLGCMYKAINTMDSMLGYKNDRYLYFGRCAAKLDDLANYLPSRLCAIIMILVSPLCCLDRKNARRIWRRDRRKHASPNSAQTEAVMAGALNVRLAGNAWYFGKLHVKPYIGDDLRPIEPGDILRANRLMYAAAAVQFLLSISIRGIIYAAL